MALAPQADAASGGAPAGRADAPFAALVDALPALSPGPARLDTPAAIASVALLPVRVAGEPAHAMARPWVSDTDALEDALARALGERYRVLPARKISDASHRNDSETLSHFADEPARAARLNQALGTEAVVAARVRVLESSGFFARAPVLHLEVQMWAGTEAGAAQRFQAQAMVADDAGRFTTWNPVLLASIGVGLLALRGRPAGSDVARAARFRAQRGRAASSGGVDLPISLG